jgi:hypothetical protein
MTQLSQCVCFSKLYRHAITDVKVFSIFLSSILDDEAETQINIDRDFVIVEKFKH